MTSSEPTGISRIPLSGRPDLCAAIIGEFKSTRYFLGVPDAMLEAMLKTAHLVRLPPGHVLISEGAGNADVFYFLLSGSVGLESGGKYLYSINNAGESVGELAVITQTPRSADVITEQVTKVVEIQWRVIQDLERALNRELVESLYEAYRVDAAERLAGIREAAARQNVKGLEEEAHSLQGASGNLGLRRTAACARQIVVACRQGRSGEGFALIPTLETTLEKTLGALASEGLAGEG